jgi:hypothetical protein
MTQPPYQPPGGEPRFPQYGRPPDTPHPENVPYPQDTPRSDETRWAPPGGAS